MFKVIFAVVLLLLAVPKGWTQSGSKEKVYNSFILLNKELEETKVKLQASTGTLYYRLTQLYQKNGEEAQTSFDLGMRIKESKNELIRYINELKGFLIAKSEGKTRSEVLANDTLIGLENLENFDDCHTPEELLMKVEKFRETSRKYSVDDFTDQINKFQSITDSVLTPDELENGLRWHYLPSSFHRTGSWNTQKHPFREKPLAGIITYLSKIQVDVLLTEKAAVDHLIWRESSKE